MEPVIQEEKTGCAIAASAAIARLSYAEAKTIANRIGVHAEDESLWSDTRAIRKLLSELAINIDDKELDFIDWQQLPDCALLAAKWHMHNGKPYWHWAVFVRESNDVYVLDSKKALHIHRRKDFGRIKPKWYIPVYINIE